LSQMKGIEGSGGRASHFVRAFEKGCAAFHKRLSEFTATIDKVRKSSGKKSSGKTSKIRSALVGRFPREDQNGRRNTRKIQLRPKEVSKGPKVGSRLFWFQTKQPHSHREKGRERLNLEGDKRKGLINLAPRGRTAHDA